MLTTIIITSSLLLTDGASRSLNKASQPLNKARGSYAFLFVSGHCKSTELDDCREEPKRFGQIQKVRASASKIVERCSLSSALGRTRVPLAYAWVCACCCRIHKLASSSTQGGHFMSTHWLNSFERSLQTHSKECTPTAVRTCRAVHSTRSAANSFSNMPNTHNEGRVKRRNSSSFLGNSNLDAAASNPQAVGEGFDCPHASDEECLPHAIGEGCAGAWEALPDVCDRISKGCVGSWGVKSSQ